MRFFDNFGLVGMRNITKMQIPWISDRRRVFEPAVSLNAKI